MPLTINPTLNLERIASAKTLEGLPLTMLILGGVDRHSTWKGSAKTLEGLPLTMLILGGGSTLNLGIDRHSTWKGSAKTLEGLPLTMLILGGGRSTLNLERIRKDFGRIASDNADPGGGGRSTLNLERIRKDFGRIASDNADPGGGSIDRHSTWKGSAKTLEGLPLTMLILGGGRSTLNLERIRKDFGRIASDNADPGGGSIDTQLGKDPQRLWKDCL